jgi:serine/threonine-protein kinase RsbW
LEEKFEFTVESKLENLQKIGEFLEKTMKHFNIDDVKELHAVQLSVDEACTNIIEHAYANKIGGVIVIRCMLSGAGDKFLVNIIDWGEPFDPTTKADPDTGIGLNERKEGGLGIFFIRKFMDEVKYVREDNKNLLVMAKNIKEKQNRQVE